MRQLIFLLASAAILHSCSPGNKDLKTVEIDFANTKAGIPKQYAFTELKEFKNIYLNSETPQPFKEATLNKLQVLESHSITVDIYQDANQPENYIWFQQAQYAKFNENLKRGILNSFEERMREEFMGSNIEYKKLEGKAFEGAHSEIIKYKYKISIGNRSNYITQYILSAQKTTLGVIVNNSSNEDYEDIISLIELN